MSREKEPLTDEQFDRVLQAAIRKDGGPEASGVGECQKVILLLRYTGMHVSVLARPNKYALRVEGMDIVWNRTKKQGKMAHTSIPISRYITFDVKGYIEQLKHRARRRSRQYFYALVRDIGERAGINDLSPMSFRHTLAVAMLDDGYPEPFVCQTLNCSRATMETYSKYSQKRRRTLFEKMGW